MRLVPVGVQGGPQFTVYTGCEAITRNSREVLSRSELQLNTQLLPTATSVAKGLLLASTDAAQCAAVARALAAEIDFPGLGGDG